jgi:galactokinase/mevalonate kinase-like predicted kinase
VPVHIRAKAPLRLSFAGGGTDIAPFMEREGGCVLSATITRYSWGTLTGRSDEQIHIESADLGAGGGGYLLLYCEYEKKHKVAEAVKKLGGIPTEFSFEFHGLQTWRRNGHGNNGNR